ncbi:heme-binding protein [Novosphingobium flavum]|uniref:Heme-binding protein n=1 Tax=Novosphingobium flavum TaxID=1778672 RepID=A0A7X1KMT9_9SPHN|nr:heme-binding protein [Novosphingobium flavum]MBC2667004.1 heme-binding protein [Novosphingobium flavum]
MSLTLEAYRSIVAAAQAEAEKLGKPLTVCVVDAGGYAIGLERMDNARALQPSIALAKAYSAAVMQRPTRMLKWWADNDPHLFSQVARMGHQPVVAGDGGVPIKKGGVIIGGLGVSGGTGQEDEDVAMVALKVAGFEIDF